MVAAGRYSTPEEAALSGWGPSARARVIRALVDGDVARVIVDTEPSHPMEVVCVRGDDGLWDWTSDSSLSLCLPCPLSPPRRGQGS